ncbi:hypothetical protein [Nocardioides sp. L-11A]|uniref:hypothetical protein n=1 Tax=Nocardioides sp. L-11A TaxID=3043848 RepID=UPI00249BA151|nr:hypothetical protein QJ852_09750 [Nocardioides sp. L-11A]
MYAGVQFYFDIPVGHLWRHELSAKDRNTGRAMIFDEPGWVATCVLRDSTGTQLAVLNNAGTGDGAIVLGTGMVALELDAGFTATLAPTTAYRPMASKAFVYADVSLTDPQQPGQPFVLARGKGVVYLPTTVTP